MNKCHTAKLQPNHNSSDSSCGAQARRLAVQSFLNAFLKETGSGELIPNDPPFIFEQPISPIKAVISIELEGCEQTLVIPLGYHSEFGQHQLASLPLLVESVDAQQQWTPEPDLLIALILRHLWLTRDHPNAQPISPNRPADPLRISNQDLQLIAKSQAAEAVLDWPHVSQPTSPHQAACEDQALATQGHTELTHQSKAGPARSTAEATSPPRDSPKAPRELYRLLKRFTQSQNNTQIFLREQRSTGFDPAALDQSFIESERALVAGHSMHPAPKSRVGFTPEQLIEYSPETSTGFALNYWLIAASCLAQGSAIHPSPSQSMRLKLEQTASLTQLEQLTNYSSYELLALHPWQADHLQKNPSIERLVNSGQIIQLGKMRPLFYPTTSVRTLYSAECDWMIKCSLSIQVTNSLRINLHKECLRGEIASTIWTSEFGAKLKQRCPTLDALNDPGWTAIIDLSGEVIDESICIWRQNVDHERPITSMAALCQQTKADDSRLKRLLEHCALSQNRAAKEQSCELDGHHLSAKQFTPEAHPTLAINQLTSNWFAQFLQVAVAPLLEIYHRHGMAFEAHQQNTLLELKGGWPARFWLRDNQGFFYIEETAGQILGHFPQLKGAAASVGPSQLVDERFIYYFFGNTVSSLVVALARTGFISEAELFAQLTLFIHNLQANYPDSTLLPALLHQPNWPYKANLLTRLYDMDELIAPVETQSVYVSVVNPLYETAQSLAGNPPSKCETEQKPSAWDQPLTAADSPQPSSATLAPTIHTTQPGHHHA